MRIRNGRYVDKGRGGRQTGYKVTPETKEKLSTANKKSSRRSLKNLHGDKFMNAFDEHFGVLYIDLKMISGACGMMK